MALEVQLVSQLEVGVSKCGLVFEDYSALGFKTLLKGNNDNFTH